MAERNVPQVATRWPRDRMRISAMLRCDDDAGQELDARHERHLLQVLPLLGPLFSVVVLAFALWDFWCDAVYAPRALAIRGALVAVGALGYLPPSARVAPHLRAGFVYATHASAMVLAEYVLSGGFRYGLSGLTSCQFLVAAIAIRPRRFFATTAIPGALLVWLTIEQMSLSPMVNQLMLFAFSIGLSFALMLVVRWFAMQTLALEVQLLHASRRDSLTGAFNRGYLFELAEREVALARRHRRPLAIAMIDIDFFKRVNDTHGHGVGDEVLVSLARTCHAELRTIDHFGRIGGEEFVCIMPETDKAEALQCAERLRQRIAEQSVATASEPLKFTVSVGVALLGPPAQDWKALLHAADMALYRAKDAGRNCVRLAA